MRSAPEVVNTSKTVVIVVVVAVVAFFLLLLLFSQIAIIVFKLVATAML